MNFQLKNNLKNKNIDDLGRPHHMERYVYRRQR